MKKIRWKHRRHFATTNVGCIEMGCYARITNNRKTRWYAYVYDRKMMFKPRTGPLRHSQKKAKEDAVRLAGEVLLDYHAGLKLEMANFGLVE